MGGHERCGLLFEASERTAVALQIWPTRTSNIKYKSQELREISKSVKQHFQ